VQPNEARERNPAADQRVLGQKIKPDLKHYTDINQSDWNSSGITASASPAEHLGIAVIKLCILS
jgi:hypothetical protein